MLMLLALGLGASAAPALSGVKITSPKPHATISGIVPVVAVTDGISVFSYATLSVDANGKSLTNENPLRFDLDTTRLANGPHSLQVAVSDDSGILAVSSALPVLVMNAGFTMPISSTKPASPVAKTTPPATKQAAKTPALPVRP